MAARYSLPAQRLLKPSNLRRIGFIVFIIGFLISYTFQLKMKVDKRRCLYCGGCVGICPAQALELKETVLTVYEDKCVKCMLCVKFCPVGAIRGDD